MRSKKWSLLFLKIFFSLFIIIGIMVVILDPYFHYHAPLKGITYSFAKEAYVNDGITKNFDYNAIITGTSMTMGFDTQEANHLFGKNFIRITYQGEGFKKINDNLKKALEVNPSLDFVIRGVDPIWFISDENWLGYDEYPEYLYDDNLWNDVYYIYNKEIFVGDVLTQIKNTINKVPTDKLDNYGMGDRSKGGKQAVLERYDRIEKQELEVDENETREYFTMLDKNLEKNLLSTVKENPNTMFYLFFPPYSICWWDDLNQYGQAVLKRRIDLEKYAIEKILQHENIKLFSFNNNYELISNLDNYVDEAHYVDEVNSEILSWMKQGKYELTVDNYKKYIDEITEFYCEYNYDSIF